MKLAGQTIRLFVIESLKNLKEDGYFTAVQDIYFKSPSATGAVVLGRTSNGRKD